MRLPIPAGSDAEWLATLKPYQRNSLSTLLVENGYEQCAKIWLSSNGPAGTARFGGVGETGPFWERFKDEFRKYVCGHDAYASDRELLSEQGPITREVLVAAISSALGATIGYSATFLAPAVTLLLITTGKMGVNAFCNDGEPDDEPKSR